MSESEIAQKSAAERRAKPRRRSKHRGDARQHLDVEPAPSRIARFDRLEHGGGHREDAGIAARDERDAAPLRRASQRLARALQLDAIVAADARLPLARGQAREIRTIADQILRRLQRHARVFGEIAGAAGPKPDDKETSARVVHGRRPCPGASTIAK